MSDAFRRGEPIPLGVMTNAVVTAAANPNAIVASAQKMTGSLSDHLIQNRQWQREVWDFYHAMGEFYYGITWLSSMCSRVRLQIGKKVDGKTEPEIIKPDEATGNDLKACLALSSLSGGIGGHAAILKSLVVQLSVPGEGYLVGEQNTDESQQLLPAVWCTKSSDELRRKEIDEGKNSVRRDPSRGIDPLAQERRPSPFEIMVEEGRWRRLAPDSLVCRIWNPDEQYSFRASSAALAALPILRELDLLNRRIISELISRLVMNGFLVLPEEMTFNSRPEFKDAADPFIAEMIDIAAKAIKTPGSAAAAIPIPIKVPGAFADKIQHIKIAEYLDPKLMESRDKAIKRLATTLNMPSEVLLGVADVNHWTAWQIDEQGVKAHIVPVIEVVCQGLTSGFLRPTLTADGVPEIEAIEYVIWHDESEITAKPDLTVASKDAYDRGELSGEGYRRESGLDEDDKPDDKELRRMVLVRLALQGNTTAIGELFPDLKEAMTPTPAPGYDPETGAPLAPVGPDGSLAYRNQSKSSPADASNVTKQAPPTNGKVPATAGA
jgi:hypothetical protein